MSGERNGCPVRSKVVAGRLDLSVPENSKEVKVGASPGRPGRMVAGSPLEARPSEAVQVDVEREFAASSVIAGGLGVVASPEHAVVLSPLSPPSEGRQPEVGEDDSSRLTPEGLHYRWHRCAMTTVSLDEVLGLGPPPSERSKICRVQKMLQGGGELDQQ